MFNSKMAVVVKKCVVVLLVVILTVLFCSCRMILSQEDGNLPEDKIEKEEIKIELEKSVKDEVAAKEIIVIADKYIKNTLKENTDVYGTLKVGFNSDTKIWRVVYLPREVIFGGDTWIEISDETRKVVNHGFGE